MLSSQLVSRLVENQILDEMVLVRIEATYKQLSSFVKRGKGRGHIWQLKWQQQISSCGSPTADATWRSLNPPRTNFGRVVKMICRRFTNQAGVDNMLRPNKLIVSILFYSICQLYQHLLPFYRAIDERSSTLQGLAGAHSAFAPRRRPPQQTLEPSIQFQGPRDRSAGGTDP